MNTPIYCSLSFSVITLARGDGETDEQQTSLLQDNYSSDEGSPNRRYGSHQINTPLCLIEAECPTQQPARHAFTHTPPVFDTADLQEDTTCLCHHLGWASLKTCD